MARLGVFLWVISLIILIGYFKLETKAYIELQADEPSAIPLPMNY